MPHKSPEDRSRYHKAYREKHKQSISEYQKKYRIENDFSEYKAKWYREKRFDKYGITKQDFELMLGLQNHACKICSTSFTETVRPYIDHCHNTGQVRGLLCFHCNTGLGHFKDNKEILSKAVEYLKDD